VSERPDLRELLGDDVSAEERARLERVHELLLAVGPPPELSPHLSEPTRPPERLSFLVRRRYGLLALAASIAVAAFVGGTIVGEQRSRFEPDFAVAMHGIGPEGDAVASLEVGERDDDGNAPMRLKVRGLQKLTKRGYYELLLERGKRRLPCGTFVVDEGTTTVRLSAYYDLSRTSRWVVAVHRTGHVENPPVIMTT